MFIFIYFESMQALYQYHWNVFVAKYLILSPSVITNEDQYPTSTIQEGLCNISYPKSREMSFARNLFLGYPITFAQSKQTAHTDVMDKKIL